MARNLWRVRFSARATSAPAGRSVVAMTVARQTLGRRGEDLVARRLRNAGWRIVARNVRVAAMRGELDLIAVDGAALVFVEVKARRADSLAGPETQALAVGPRKRAKVRGLAAAWLRERGYAVPRHRDLRFDVIGLRVDAAGQVVECEHIRAAF
jgi:putative endonuclease